MPTATAQLLPLPALPLVEQVDLLRVEASAALDPEQRSELGQYLTPCTIATFMASMFERFTPTTRLLDAGAGVGSLLAAALAEAHERSGPPRRIEVVAYEVDSQLLGYLKRTLSACAAKSKQHNVPFSASVESDDFILSAVESLDAGLFAQAHRFTHAILNPPYRKLNSDSATRLLLRRVGMETSNLYTGFVALAIQLLEPGGEMVAITPRSFCNGPYFRPFREFLLREAALRRIHLFESRTAAFADDAVLQENIIFHLVKGAEQGSVLVSASSGPEDEMPSEREVPFEQIVRPGDTESFIHLVPDESGRRIADAYASLPFELKDLRLAVSTGRVVDFRARPYLRQEPGKETHPLIYPTHFSGGVVRWPKPGKKPNALVNTLATADLWMPGGTYVLAKRFSSKEEKRRIVAAIFDPEIVPAEMVGFENHLNVFHADGAGIDPVLARGLAAFLNSTFVDAYFRQFSGHTQVNATDLRSLRYPSLAALRKLGATVAPGSAQQELDEAVESVLGLATMDNPLARKRKVDDALAVLKALDLPRAQQNERSALTLLAMLNLKPHIAWSKAGSPLIGITPVMDFIRDQYGKAYAPNTRETVRRLTVHQFRDAGLIVANPDDPARAVNSPKAVYQIEAEALKLLRTYGSRSWSKHLASYVKQMGTLATRYAQAREMARIPVTLPVSESVFKLTPGGQNELIKKIVEDFCPLFAPGAHVIYVGDTGDKFAVFDKQALGKLRVVVDSHGKMPDVAVHRKDKNWLLLIEAVTSHGPVNPKRRAELAQLFGGSTAGLVYVTAFLTRKAMLRYLRDISWESEVWVAESPEHMIHFDGERFLGPYAHEK